MAFNNGQPLTPDQVQSMRSQIGVQPVTTTSSDPQNQWATFEKLTGKASNSSSGGYLDRVKQAFSQGVGQAGEASKEGITDTNPLQLLESGAKAGAGLVNAVSAPISAAVSPIISPVVNKVADVISDNPAVQKFANSPAGHATSRIAEDVNNANTIAGAALGFEGAPEAVGKVGSAAGDIAGGVRDVAASASENGTNALRDAATTITPNMQTLIDRVKASPTDAATVADQLKSYFDTAEQGKGVTGAKTPLDLAGAQFKPAMAALKKNMGDVGTSMKSALEPVAGAKASGVGGILENLKNTTADRLGAEYAPMSDTSGALDGMSFKQRVNFLNDVIDGKKPDPFGGDGVFRSAPGREIAVSSAPDLKKLADLHETIANLGDNPTVQQLHDTVQRLQSDLYKANKVGAEPIDSQVKGIMKQTVGMLNEKAKETAMQAEKEQGLTPGAYADAKAKYGDLADLQENMSRRLGAGYKQSSSLIKKIFSPQNQGLNPLIEKLEKETGVKIFDHATLADFTMRSVGDPRIKSMLEHIQEGGASAKGWVSNLINYVGNKAVEHLNDPKGKALRQLGQ